MDGSMFDGIGAMMGCLFVAAILGVFAFVVQLVWAPGWDFWSYIVAGLIGWALLSGVAKWVAELG